MSMRRGGIQTSPALNNTLCFRGAIGGREGGRDGAPREHARTRTRKHMPHNSNPPLGSKAREGLLYLCMMYCFGSVTPP
jgi:hypothetical protein